jgi:hypothetical protein
MIKLKEIMKYSILFFVLVFVGKLCYSQEGTLKSGTKNIINKPKSNTKEVRLDTTRLKDIAEFNNIDTSKYIIQEFFDMNGNQITILKLKKTSTDKDSLNKVNPVINK